MPPAFGPLVTCEEAAAHVNDPTWIFFDVRYDLADKEKGVREYAKGHIPGAYFAHVDRDLSGPVGDGNKGRHPLPFEASFQRFAGTNGVAAGVKVVCYDDAAGQWASRLWWLLRHHGHADVAVLDGGLTRWKALKLPLRPGHEKSRTTQKFTGKAGAMPTIGLQDIQTSNANPAAAAGNPPILLLDARAGERFRGEVEPVDKRAGHIPGARNVPFAGGVGPDMRFLPAEALRARFEQAQAGTSAATPGVAPPRLACYCGSGVTSAHLVLEAEVAGLATPALYPGSWSEWSFPAADRPIATGP